MMTKIKSKRLINLKCYRSLESHLFCIFLKYSVVLKISNTNKLSLVLVSAELDCYG